MFSSISTLTEVFGKNLTAEERREVLRDLKKIKRDYRKERGFLKSLSVKKGKILDAFCWYEFYAVSEENVILGDWRKFVKATQTGGADFIDMYI